MVDEIQLKLSICFDLFVPSIDQVHLFHHVDSEIDRAVQHVLDENNQLLNQIDTNIQGFQVCMLSFHVQSLVQQNAGVP